MNKVNSYSTANNFINDINKNFQETGKLSHYKIKIIKERGEDTYSFSIGDFILNESDTNIFLNKLFSFCKENNKKIEHLKNIFQSCVTDPSSPKLGALESEINQFISLLEIQHLILQSKENIERLELAEFEVTNKEIEIIINITQDLRLLEKQINQSSSNVNPLMTKAQDLWMDSTKMLLLLPSINREEKHSLIRAILPLMINNPPMRDFFGNPVFKDDFHGLNTLDYIAMAGTEAQLEEVNQQLNKSLSSYITVGTKNQGGDSPLNTAIMYKNYEIAESLITRWVDINFRLNDRGEAPLLTAIKHNDLKMVDICLKKENIDTKTTDIYGYTALHRAAILEDGEMLRYLLTKNEFKVLVNSQDIFGKTPLDLALESKNDEAIKILLQDDNADVTKLPGYGVKTPDISQANIINQWAKYVEMKGNDPLHFVNSEGECFGFSFLIQYYISRGKEAEVYRILNLLAGWNGSEEALADTESVKGLSGGYKNLDDLMAQWINDVLWFQQSNGLETQSNLNINQLVEMYEIIKKDSEDTIKLLMNWGTDDREINADREQLIEIIQLLSTIPNSSLCIAGQRHATSVHFQPDGSYQYFDPNLPFKVKPIESAEELVKIIIDTQYLQLGYTEDTIELGLLWYCFPDKTYDPVEVSKVIRLIKNSKLHTPYNSLSSDYFV